MRLYIQTIIIVLFIGLILFLLNMKKNNTICIEHNPVWIIPYEESKNEKLFYYWCPNSQYAEMISKKDPLIFKNTYKQVPVTDKNTKILNKKIKYFKNDPIFKCAKLYIKKLRG